MIIIVVGTEKGIGSGEAVRQGAFIINDQSEFSAANNDCEWEAQTGSFLHMGLTEITEIRKSQLVRNKGGRTKRVLETRNVHGLAGSALCTHASSKL